MLYWVFRELLEGQHYAYENPLLRGTLAALFCFLLTLLAMPKTIRLLIRWKLGDKPQFDHATLNELTRDKSNVPTMGGLLILVAIGSSVLLFADLTNFYVKMGLLCLLWLGALGAVDDYLKLSSRGGSTRDGLKSYEKILFQVGLAVVLGYYIFRHGQNNFVTIGHLVEMSEQPAYKVLMVPFYKPGLVLGTLAFMFITVLVMTGTSNAVNLTDGMDGLASGCVSVCALVFALLAHIGGTEALAVKLLFPYVPGSGELVIFCGSVFGACLGFLWWNCHPAKVFMGDTGSLPLGGLIGFVAIVIRQELMLVIVGGVFVIEALSVVAQVGYFKWTKGRRLLRCAPIHHHFHLGGWSEPQTVVRFWIAAAMFAALALATVKLR